MTFSIITQNSMNQKPKTFYIEATISILCTRYEVTLRNEVLLVLTKVRNDLKRPKTMYNNLKPFKMTKNNQYKNLSDADLKTKN